LTRSSSPSSAEQTFVRALSSLATVTTRKTAARDRARRCSARRPALCPNSSLTSQMLHVFQNYKCHACEQPSLSGPSGMLVQSF
jgi:hypothetical protein